LEALREFSGAFDGPLGSLHALEEGRDVDGAAVGAAGAALCAVLAPGCGYGAGLTVCRVLAAAMPTARAIARLSDALKAPGRPSARGEAVAQAVAAAARVASLLWALAVPDDGRAPLLREAGLAELAAAPAISVDVGPALLAALPAGGRAAQAAATRLVHALSVTASRPDPAALRLTSRAPAVRLLAAALPSLEAAAAHGGGDRAKLLLQIQASFTALAIAAGAPTVVHDAHAFDETTAGLLPGLRALAREAPERGVLAGLGRWMAALADSGAAEDGFSPGRAAAANLQGFAMALARAAMRPWTLWATALDADSCITCTRALAPRAAAEDAVARLAAAHDALEMAGVVVLVAGHAYCPSPDCAGLRCPATPFSLGAAACKRGVAAACGAVLAAALGEPRLELLTRWGGVPPAPGDVFPGNAAPVRGLDEILEASLELEASTVLALAAVAEATGRLPANGAVSCAAARLSSGAARALLFSFRLLRSEDRPPVDEACAATMAMAVGAGARVGGRDRARRCPRVGGQSCFLPAARSKTARRRRSSTCLGAFPPSAPRRRTSSPRCARCVSRSPTSFHRAKTRRRPRPARPSWRSRCCAPRPRRRPSCTPPAASRCWRSRASRARCTRAARP
jgi:hypothetical protein